MPTARDDHAYEILLIEDDGADILLMTGALSEIGPGARVHVVRDGEEALASLKLEEPRTAAPRPDLIVLDLNLAGTDGHDLLRRIKDLPDIRRVPLVVLGSSRAPEDVSRCYEAGANCYVPKPADPHGLLPIFRRTVSFWMNRAAQAAPDRSPGRRLPLRVLLIDDNPDDTRLIQEMLRDAGGEGFSVLSAGTLRQGLDRLEKDRPDAVLLALTLPDGGASETLAAFGSLHLLTPVVILTGQPDDALSDSALRQGVQDSLVKGQFDGKQLARALRHSLERSRCRNHLQQLAQHDTLTRLPNSALFRDRLGLALEKARRYQQALGVLFIDLDEFKSINDTYGHQVGDLLLTCVGESLRSCVRASDTVARVGGDEFSLILPELGGAEDVVCVADKILSALRAPFVVGPHRLTTSCSIGASLYPGDGEDTASLVRHSDAAMYVAKEQGGNRLQFHTPATGVRLSGRDALIRELRRAIEREQFVLHYLPMIDPRGQVVGLEALIRWRHPEWGLIYPQQFIPVAEQTGLILDIGEWVLRSACADRRSWGPASARLPRVSINLSSRQLNQGKYLREWLLRTLAEHSLEPSCLGIEITEQAIERDGTAALQTLRSVSEAGIAVAIDDFGSGHFSLAHLQQLPIQEVKIDRTFTRSLSNKPGGTDLVTALIGLGHGLRTQVVAEGVESGEQMQLLVEHGVDFMQGHYIGRPMPASACNAMIASPPPVRP